MNTPNRPDALDLGSTSRSFSSPLSSPRRTSVWRRAARAIAFAAPAAALVLACSSRGASESSESSASAVTSCPAGGELICEGGCITCKPAVAPICVCKLPPASPSTCTGTPAPNAGIALSSTIGALTLTGTSNATAVDATTTSFTIKSGTTAWLTLTQEIASGSTTTQIDYGAPFTGVTTAIFTTDGTTNTGSINGRALVAQSSKSPKALAFQDSAPAPAITVTAGTQTAIYALLDQARAAALVDCPGAAAGVDAAALPPALSSLVASLGHAPAPGATGTALAAAPQEVVRKTELTSSNPVEYQNYQNSPVDIITTNCTSCYTSCAESVTNWFTGWGFLACEGECWIPGQGCGQVVCGVGASCDKGETCCGGGGNDTTGGCCPSGSVCGSQQFGLCCPAAMPVACANSTGGECFPAGTTCCDGGLTACGAGQVCVSGGTGCCPTGDAWAGTQCCPTNQVYGSGECCSTPTCGGVCCTGGQCVSGQCQMPTLGGPSESCDATPYTAVALSDTTVPDSAWAGQWIDPTAQVQLNLGVDATSGIDGTSTETQIACGTGALSAIIGTLKQATDNVAYENAWSGVIPTACVSSPPAGPTSEPFSVNVTKSLTVTSGSPYTYLTLYTYKCQGGSVTAPQYAVRYTRADAAGGQVYADYMLNPKALLQ